MFEYCLTMFSKAFMFCTRSSEYFGVVIECIYPFLKGCEEKNGFYIEWHPQRAELNWCSLPVRELYQ